jgi:hypothetical protein
MVHSPLVVYAKWQSRFSVDDLQTDRGCRRAFDQLIDMSDEQLAQEDIGLVNLLCAVGLPSADPLNIPFHLAQLDRIAEYTRQELVNGYPRYIANPNPAKGSEAVYKLWAVMHAVRVKVGIEAKYKRVTAEEIKAREFTDTSMTPTGGPYKNRVNSQVGFIHGLLSPRCLGCCASNPVLFAAVARRLGFPVKLVLTVQHVFNRWVDDSEQFNMDGSMGRIGGDADHHYINRWRPWRNWELKSTALHRPLTPREELAAFLFTRSACESANLRFESALNSCKIAARLQPDQQVYVDEQTTIQLNQAGRRERERVAFNPLKGHYPEIVTASGNFSTKTIQLLT